VTAEFCGLKGQWPPYRTSQEAYVAILIAVATGMQKSVKAIREVDPDATIWAAESTKNYHPVNEEARPYCTAALRKDLVVWDLVHGRVDEKHACYNWLKDNGISDEQLAALRDNAVTMDVLGLNFYPWLSQTYEWKDGRIDQFWDWNGRLLIELLRGAHEYTGATLCVTETSAHGGGGARCESVLTNAGDFRSRWMDETLEAVEQARREGIPVLGYTQFPLFTMIDWSYRTAPDATPEDFFCNFGMIEVDSHDYSRKWTPVADRFLHHMRTFETETNNATGEAA
jgi:beta-glucosidase/6-phospho-beta-glucosidase/beta-galactosidase